MQLLHGSSCGKKVETALQYCYFFSIALSPLGPVCHYSLWGVCFLLLLWSFFVCRRPLALAGLPRDGAAVFVLLSGMALWTALAGLFSFDKITYYGRNVTPLFEIVFGAYLAMRTLRDERLRKRFITIFVVISTLILLGNLLRLTGVLHSFPNRALKNGNSLGALGMLLFPPVITYAFWSAEHSFGRKLLLVLPVCGVVLLSFSSGAWLSSFLGGLVFLYYSIRYKKLTLRFVIVAAVVLVVCLAAFDSAQHGHISRKIFDEFRQVQAIDDLDKFTTLRNQVWSATWHMVKERPVLGSGGELFFNKHRWLMQHKAKELGLTVKRDVDHPHSTYFYLLYMGGVPALILFVAAMCLCLRRMIRLARTEKNVFFPWAVMSLMLLTEILTYGTNGDILQGRRDIAVMVWCFIGVMAMLPEPVHK